jgi:hypothetical protein
VLNQTDPGAPSVSKEGAVGGVLYASYLGDTFSGCARDDFHSVSESLGMVLLAIAVRVPNGPITVVVVHVHKYNIMLHSYRRSVTRRCTPRRPRSRSWCDHDS